MSAYVLASWFRVDRWIRLRRGEVGSHAVKIAKLLKMEGKVEAKSVMEDPPLCQYPWQVKQVEAQSERQVSEPTMEVEAATGSASVQPETSVEKPLDDATVPTEGPSDSASNDDLEVLERSLIAMERVSCFLGQVPSVEKLLPLDGLCFVALSILRNCNLRCSDFVRRMKRNG